jgi:hypothetical protein
MGSKIKRFGMIVPQIKRLGTIIPNKRLIYFAPSFVTTSYEWSVLVNSHWPLGTRKSAHPNDQ